MNVRTRRVKKTKIIDDLGYEDSVKNLSKKTKKNTYQCKSRKNIKIYQKLFSDFKSMNKTYHEFPLFSKIEKKIKANAYSHYIEFANEMRNTFSLYFINYSNNIDKYPKIFSLSDSFENIYKEYDNKIFTKESKNLIEIRKRLSKLRKELKDTYHQSNQIVSKSTKLKISVNGELINSSSQKSNREFKVALANKIRNLSPEQKKGLLNIICHSYLDKTNNDIMEIDVNKMPLNQLREIERYIDECNGVTEQYFNVPNENTNKEKKDEDLFDELSESLSSDNDDSSDMSD